MIHFTSDWHLGDERMELLMRPFSSYIEQSIKIIFKLDEVFKNGDTLYHLGDVVVSNERGHAHRVLEGIRNAYPDSRFVLIKGNYDTDMDLMSALFDEVHDDYELQLEDESLYLNHYPVECRKNRGDRSFGVTGHIHGLWKVKRDMVNVGIDVWNYRPVSQDDLMFIINGIRNHYDENVFL